MKKLFTTILSVLMLWLYSGMNLAVIAATQTKSAQVAKTCAVHHVEKRPITFAFVFDGPSDKNQQVLKQFQSTISKSVSCDYTATFPSNLIYTGDWTESGVKKVSDKALASNAVMVISLGYISSKYYAELKNKNKFVITIDQYGLRGFGKDIFNPVHEACEKLQLFKRLTNYNKVAILINESYYKTQKDWYKFLEHELKPTNINYNIISVNNNVDGVLAKIPADTDAVFVTPLYNLSVSQRKELFDNLANKKIKTFSSVGKEDVELGALLGSGSLDLDKKLAEATSFNIQGVLKGEGYKSEKLYFYEDNILAINMDTADKIGYIPHLRLLNNAEVISTKKNKTYTLGTVFSTLEQQNLDIERKRLLVKAAKNSVWSASLKYLPTLNMTLGYQKYDNEFAESAKLTTPEETGIFKIGLDQMIYSPALVTNILIKKKKLDFQKAEQTVTEQNMGIDVALLYLQTLMLENAIKNQKDYVKESRENLAISRVREKMGFCGKEETLRWASQLNINEQHLLEMTADYKNVKLNISKLLNNPQNVDFDLSQLKADDPAFYTKDLHVIDYVRTPVALENFTQMLVDEAIFVAPELSKLRAAIKMKNDEAGMYYQKFILPDAKLSLEYTSLFGREYSSPMAIPIPVMGRSIVLPPANATNGRLGIFAQWKPIEGGTKIAEIARINNEKKELNRYMDEVKIQLEEEIRGVVNKAISAYFSIEKNYKAMFAAQENYLQVKDMYWKGKAPITQLIDAQNIYLEAKLKAANSQYDFFKQLVWVQRGLCSVNWETASPEAKAWIQKVKDNLVEMKDIRL
ncbi:MAG: TolC family protein [Candidatus Gastranaerophilales bacterium]|nr:TolC family protein [Candidatus Gastranaerophilales bacterium]